MIIWNAWVSVATVIQCVMLQLFGCKSSCFKSLAQVFMNSVIYTWWTLTLLIILIMGLMHAIAANSKLTSPNLKSYIFYFKGKLYSDCNTQTFNIQLLPVRAQHSVRKWLCLKLWNKAKNCVFFVVLWKMHFPNIILCPSSCCAWRSSLIRDWFSVNRTKLSAINYPWPGARFSDKCAYFTVLCERLL